MDEKLQVSHSSSIEENHEIILTSELKTGQMEYKIQVVDELNSLEKINTYFTPGTGWLNKKLKYLRHKPKGFDKNTALMKKVQDNYLASNTPKIEEKKTEANLITLRRRAIVINKKRSNPVLHARENAYVNYEMLIKLAEKNNVKK